MPALQEHREPSAAPEQDHPSDVRRSQSLRRAAAVEAAYILAAVRQ